MPHLGKFLVCFRKLLSNHKTFRSYRVKLDFLLLCFFFLSLLRSSLFLSSFKYKVARDFQNLLVQAIALEITKNIHISCHKIYDLRDLILQNLQSKVHHLLTASALNNVGGYLGLLNPQRFQLLCSLFLSIHERPSVSMDVIIVLLLTSSTNNFFFLLVHLGSESASIKSPIPSGTYT